MTDTSPGELPQPQRFGTFLGVYTPSVLTILGVMMYLRFGWVVGNTGLPLSFLIVVLCSSITLITGLSASAIATNMRVGVGGEYYMISRSLGLELGGAIGIPLFLCRTLSLTLYAFGLAESLTFLWPAEWGPLRLQWMAAVIIVCTTAIAGKSAAASLKLQLPIMVAVGLSLLALAGGIVEGGITAPEMVPHYERSAPDGFWYVLAVFFPAVTGFTAGIGMSGDLEDPKRSIPKGTLLAVLTGAVIYVGILLALSTSAKVDGPSLASLDPNAPPIWTSIALFGVWLIYPGMWGAILSSAFGSALGGPRVLQALANDGLAPRLLSRTSRTGQPTIATWITGLIALGAVALGDLNAVGRWVTIFFLTLYVTINLAAALEQLVGDPSYRPTIKVPWIISFGGSVGAVVVMFLINKVACGAAIGLELLLYLYLRRKAYKSSWGDVRAGMWTALARFALLKLRVMPRQARNWRPLILLFTNNPAHRIGLVRLASWFNQKRGVVTVCQLVVGDLHRLGEEARRDQDALNVTLTEEGLAAFGEVNIVPEFESGLIGVAQANGFAGLQSNTLMFGWPNDDKGLALLLRVTRIVAPINKSIIIARLPEDTGLLSRRQIDVWWGGLESNGDLMLLLAHLLSLNPEWHMAEITLRTIVPQEEKAAMVKRMEDLINEVRIEARCDVIINDGQRSVVEIMHSSSHSADVVVIGLALPEEGTELAYAGRLFELAHGFPATIVVRNSEHFAGQLI